MTSVSVRQLGCFLIVIALVGQSHGLSGQAPARPTVRAEDELAEGQRSLRRGDNFQALQRFRRANELAGGSCGECLIAMTEAMLNMKAYANVLETAQLAIDVSADQPAIGARAHAMRGDVYRIQADTDPARHQDAEREYRAAIGLDAENEDTHFGLGMSLLKLGRDEEAIVELKRYLAIRDIGPVADEVRGIIANPRRGRERFVPDFTIQTVDGVRLTPESLRGKVVLYDFWATWCPPCVEAVPTLRKLQAKYANAPFVIVGISTDNDEYVWRRFTVDQKMIWPQFWDRQRYATSRFGVVGFPTYVLADGEGVERLRVMGTGLHRSRALTDAIDRELARVTGSPR